MTEAKKILITTRSREVIVVRPALRMNGFCAACGAERELISLDGVSAMTSLGTRDVISQIDAGMLHSVENTAGRLLICAESLKETF